MAICFSPSDADDVAEMLGRSRGYSHIPYPLILATGLHIRQVEQAVNF